MKKSISVIAFLLCAYGIHGQADKRLNIGIGISTGTHQNQTFSQSSLSGLGVGFQFGYSHRTKNLFRSSFDLTLLTVKQNDVESTESLVLNPSFSASWLKGIQSQNDRSVYIGAELEGALLVRSSSNLGNNGSSQLFSNTLSAVALIERPISTSKWIFGGELAIGLISWARASDGFAFSEPQTYLTDGAFNYDEDVSTKFYKYGELATIGKFNRIKTKISISKDGKNARWGFHYSWSFRSYKPFEGGQIVQGTHGFRYFVGFKLGKNKQGNKS